MKRIIILSVAAAGAMAAHSLGAPFINSPPFIDPIPDQTIVENSPLSFSFHVSDPDAGDLANLLVTATSANQDLFQTGNLVISGSGENRTLFANPEFNKVGTVAITLAAADNLSLFARVVNVTILPENAVATPDENSSALLTLLSLGALATVRHSSFPRLFRLEAACLF